MNQPLYIASAVAISPQDSFEPENFLQTVRHTDRGWLSVVDAPYQDYINPVAIRRMSRILKVSISAAMAALQRSGIGSPDAIITGTGRGVVTDMEQFVKDLDRLKEATLNPTLFIQSTYNSANGWIAMQSKCQGYNQTYVHRGISFELALQDAMMLSAEDSGTDCILCGAFDEITGEHYHIQGKLGMWRNPAIDSRQLYEIPGAGTVAGEGSAFFMLCRQPGNATAVVRGMRIIHEPDGAALHKSCHELLQSEGLDWDDLDLIVSGYNGDENHASLYYELEQSAYKTSGHVYFKHWVGEYNTATAFGLWLANEIIKNNRIYQSLTIREVSRPTIKTVLLVNNQELQTASAVLICGTALTGK